eukprot:2366761-Karenia_brevis.AAC.1
MGDGAVILHPKLGYRESILQTIDDAISNNVLTAAQASSLHGKLGALDLALLGRVLRGSLSALTARQYYESVTHI